MANIVNLKAVITAKDEASGVLRGFAQSTNQVGNSIHTIMSRISTAFSIAAGAAAGFAVKSAIDFEQARVAFDTMLGSGEAAQKMMKNLSDFARRTPFQLPEVITGSKQLLAYGISAEKIIPTMEAIGDIASGVGKDKLPFLTLAFGQVASKGKLYAQEIRQFTEAGVPLIDELSKSLGVNREQVLALVEDGKVGFADVEKAIFSMSGEGGKFYDLMRKQSKTLGGTISNLQDDFGRLARSIVGVDELGNVIAGSLFDKLRNAGMNLLNFIDNNQESILNFFKKLGDIAGSIRDAFSEVASAIGNYLAPKFENLAAKINEVLPVFQRLWHEVLEPVIKVLADIGGKSLLWALGAVIDSFAWLIDNVIKPFIGFITENKEFLYPFIFAFGALKAAMLFDAAFNAITMGFATFRLVTIPGAIASLGTLQAALTGFAGWGIFLGVALGAFQKIMDKLNEINRTIDNTNKGIDTLENAKSKAAEQYRSGQITKERYNAILNNASGGNALGTESWRGGSTWVGESGPEKVNLPRGSQIIPNNKVGGNTTINISVNAGAFTGSKMEARKFAQMIMGAYADAMDAKGMAV